MNLKDKLVNFIKTETVVFISMILALISCFVITPDKEYISYIDFRSLSILLSLMFVMSGLRTLGVFEKIGIFLLEKTSTIKSLSYVLVFLCFIFSMFITNDVALITFVPFTIELLVMAGLEQYMIRIIVLQTIAANLGSMLTPIGNPQNLYLYSLTSLTLTDFIKLMLPYTLVSALLLAFFTFVSTGTEATEVRIRKQIHFGAKEKRMITLYCILFIISLTAVARILPFYIVLVVVFLSVLIFDWTNIKKPDYNLLLTFVFLFIFIGNLGRIESIHLWLSKVVTGRETITAILASQITSNVPAAILLSGFTNDVKSLIVGTNLGGLGTLIASMASLISYKFFGKSQSEKRLSYIGVFTLYNLLFLAVLLIIYYLRYTC